MAAAAAAYSTPREHVEWIRRERYYIGRDDKNPLAEDIHQAVLYLSEELYSKDVHFLMELIQNAEDNKYAEGVTPSLEFLITSKDITMTGAKTTLLLFNNEIGFSPSNIDSICRIGKSTKKGKRHLGYIGEKGIGFKSVFLISSKPYIFSNGYQICFNEEPSPDCNLGYIVPEWVDENPSLSDLQNLYGPSERLPTTIIILPLKIEKESAVKQQLSNLQPEVLLFLSKIRELSVRRDNDDSTCNTGCKISISGEDTCQKRRNFNAESYPLHLTAQEGDKGDEEQCCYYMWKQRFPVKRECISKKRAEVDEWVITLAFPFGKRLNRGTRKSGVYSFLPIEMETGFPFIIQADFLLVSSRESIQLNSPWNEGILNCVPSAFTNAFITLIKGAHEAPSFSIPFLFNFIPVEESHIKLLDRVRQSIKEKIITKRIIPCELNNSQKMFCKPSEIKRLVHAFWRVLIKAQKSGVDILNLHSHGSHIVNAYLDNDEYNNILGFLGVGYVDLAWYASVIRGFNLAKGMPDDIYVELLHFIALKWNSCFKDLPLLRFIDATGNISLLSVSQAAEGNKKLCIANNDEIITWLINWNREFISVSKLYFMPQTTQLSLRMAKSSVMNWLKDSVKLQSLSLSDYGSIVITSLTRSKHVIAFTHFLYHSHKCKYAKEWCINTLVSCLPIVDEYGKVILEKTEVLVPASMGKWIMLMGSNPWRAEKYFVLSSEYLATANFAGNVTCEGQILKFLQQHGKASDVPQVYPPNAAFKTVYSPLTKDNAFLLLEWIRNIRSRGTNCKLQIFFSSIKTGSWLKTSIGYSPPSESFLPSSGWGRLLQVASTLVDIPLILKDFYGEKITEYTEELKEIGVRFDFMDASEYIGSHIRTATADSALTRAKVFSLLNLVRYLGEVSLSPDYLIQSTKTARWLKTSVGFRLASESILLLDSEWTLASHVSNLPFIDTSFYGEQIADYKIELQLFGVLVGFNKNYQIVVDNFEMPSSYVSADAAIFILDCIRNACIPDDLFTKLSQTEWLKTQLGYQNPGESFLAVLEWECLLQVVSGIPVIDEAMYDGRIRSYQEELKKVGVAVTIDDFLEAIAFRLNHLLEGRSITNKNVLALLSCYRQFVKKEITLTHDLFPFSLGKEWLYTNHGFRSPKASILFSPEWEPISTITNLPFIDGNSAFYGYSNKINDFKNELKALGVVVDFKEGAKLVIDSINLPRDPSIINPVSIISLLQCILNLKENAESLPMEFKQRMKSRWIKTVFGYRTPEESILFDPKWSLPRKDGPFIDDSFYGSELTSYKRVLKEIGVSVNATQACMLLALHIKCHSDIITISRVYLFLNEHKWKADDEAAEWIWIPSGGGQWVSSSSCILHDKVDLFSSQLFILDKYYDTKILDFFSRVFKVRVGPCLDDYCKLWSSWEVSAHHLTVQQCSFFWVFIANHWNSNTEKILLGSISKLPVNRNDEVILSNKEDVFIPDDLLLKELFGMVSETIFVWYPQVTSPALSRANMNKIYSSIGVQSISEAVEKDESFRTTGASVRKVNQKFLIWINGLLRIVLAFLSDTSLDIIANERHRLVKYLLDLEVLEIDAPVTVSYKLTLSSGTILDSKATRLFRWEKDKAKLFLQRDDGGTKRKRDGGMKRKRHNIEYATNFADVIAKGLLSEMPDQIDSLAQLICFGCLLDFEEYAVNYLLKSKNLQLFPEDEEFLSSISSKKNVRKVEAGKTTIVLD
ncbi:uncharacterized protein LOC121980120 [Zingiber officinale]|uniref:Sacsin/Nov domain-containing protein n=1 Tax=Zingiber officinale TaxID=94328 RepID=A0A8J5L889_ZINOF|nr:uncharacterized protein LOC121980120 [Zingiber officinale]KAG6508895.1 hypothetical protein ZIOFF_034277 [Zingiber officinale]